jgi:hypothetical protein
MTFPELMAGMVGLMAILMFLAICALIIAGCVYGIVRLYKAGRRR